MDLAKQMIEVVLKPEEKHEIFVPSTYYSPTCMTLVAVAQYIDLEKDIAPVKKRISDQEDQELELSELEQRIEQARKLLNKAKFSKVEGQLENVVWLLQDCNTIFDKVFELRRMVLQPDFFKILKVNENSSPLEIKRAYH